MLLLSRLAAYLVALLVTPLLTRLADTLADLCDHAVRRWYARRYGEETYA